MKFDTTISIIGIITICSIFSPIITAIINNKHNYRMKKLEINSLRRNELINDFINATLSYRNTYSTKIKFYEALNKILCYTDTTSSKYLGKVKYIIEKDGFDIKELNSALMNFIMRINK